jgi:hypothetical protein
MGWSLLRLGQRAKACEQAERSVCASGDSGSLRLRAIALNLLAHAEEDQARAAEARRRAADTAVRLEDDELNGRYGCSLER